MQKAPIPRNEGERMEAVHRMNILNTAPEERFDVLTREAVQKLNVPISTVTILDDDLEWFKSRQGLEKKEGDRDVSFCGHALLTEDIFIVPDTLKDQRFVDNPMVVNSPFIRFYAGIALLDYKTSQPIGVFCVKDIKPHSFGIKKTSILADLANRAEIELNK